MRGDLYLLPNDGSNAHPAYGAPRKLEAGGQPIKGPHHGDAQPVVADWDGDGLPDLIVGWGDGSVVWYRNLGSRTDPKLALGVVLVRAAPEPNYDDNAPPSRDAQPGQRAKVCVVDWNGDGRLDLLVGDFGGIYGEKARLSDQDQKTEQEANRKVHELQQKMQPFYDEYALKLKAAAKRERQQEAQAVLKRKEFQELQKEMHQATEAVRKFRRPLQHQCHVWLYLRKSG